MAEARTPRCVRAGCGHKLTEHERHGGPCERFSCGCRLFQRQVSYTQSQLDTAVRTAVEAERERCAKIARAHNDFHADNRNCGYNNCGLAIAREIENEKEAAHPVRV